MLFVRCRRRKKNRGCSFLLPFYHGTKRKNAFPFSFPGRRKKKQYAFLCPLLENSQKEKERRTSHFLLRSFPAADGMADLPFPEKEKRKRKRREDGRTQTEGRRTKTKRNGKKGKGWEKRQRNISQKGTFPTQESRKRTGRGFPSGIRKRG